MISDRPSILGAMRLGEVMGLSGNNAGRDCKTKPFAHGSVRLMPCRFMLVVADSMAVIAGLLL